MTGGCSPWPLNVIAAIVANAASADSVEINCFWVMVEANVETCLDVPREPKIAA
jgi:hypothetical protein